MMGRYRVLARSYVGGAIRNPGEVVDHDPRDGHVSWNLEPLDPEEHAKWAKVYADEAKVEDAALAERGGFPRRPGDPEPYTVASGS